MTTYTHPDNITALPYYQQVLRGMAYIDQQHLNKRWVDDVPLDALDMGDPGRDVLAHTLGPRYNSTQLSQELGFYAPVDHDTLTDTWRVLLRLRHQLPPLPDDHVFIGVGNARNSVVHKNVRRCYGWEEGIRWEDRWSSPGETLLRHNNVAYCVHRDHALAQPYTIEENKPMNDDTPELTLHSSGDGVVYQGYHFTDDDIEKLMTLVRATTSLRNAGFDVEINEVSVGCQEFTRRQLNDLYAQYKQLKEQPKGFTVKRGDRVEYTPVGTVYIVASVGYTSYLLIDTATGSRYSDITVNDPEDRRAIPFVDFLTSPNDLSNWRKV